LGERLNGIQEVRGSTPLGSTSLRRFVATAGKPANASRSSIPDLASWRHFKQKDVAYRLTQKEMGRDQATQV
jgi:hypothetical protein